MRVLPDGSHIAEDAWEVAHTYMVVAFRKRGAPVRPQARRDA